jgi:hypothetical protein
MVPSMGIQAFSVGLQQLIPSLRCLPDPAKDDLPQSPDVGCIAFLRFDGLGQETGSLRIGLFRYALSATFEIGHHRAAILDELGKDLFGCTMPTPPIAQHRRRTPPNISVVVFEELDQGGGCLGLRPPIAQHLCRTPTNRRVVGFEELDQLRKKLATRGVHLGMTTAAAMYDRLDDGVVLSLTRPPEPESGMRLDVVVRISAKDISQVFDGIVMEIRDAIQHARGFHSHLR